MTKKTAEIKAIVRKGGWFRMYADILNDPKVQLLPERHFKFWVNCLALTSERRGYLPNAREIAFRLRMSETEAEDSLACLMTHGLIDRVEFGGMKVMQPHNWFQWQPSPDPSKYRMRRLRERRKSTGSEGGDGDVTVGVTRHVTKCAYSKSTVTEGNTSARDALWPSTSRDALSDGEQVSIQERTDVTVVGGVRS